MAWGEIWQRWVKRFWFLRGVAAAIAVAQLAPAVLDLTRFEFLRAFYALLVGWTDCMEWLAAPLRRLPFLTWMNGHVLNALLFSAAVAIPGAFVLARYGYEIKNRGKLERPLYAHVIWSASIISAVFLPVTGYVAYLLVFDSTVLAATWPEMANLSGDRPRLAQQAVILFVGFLFAALRLPGYLKGLVTVVMFVLTMQALYWLGTPGLADTINALANRSLPIE